LLLLGARNALISFSVAAALRVLRSVARSGLLFTPWPITRPIRSQWEDSSRFALADGGGAAPLASGIWRKKFFAIT